MSWDTRLVGRILLLAAIFVLELTLVSIWLDTDSLVQRAQLIQMIHDWGAWCVRCIVGFAAIFATFAYLNYRSELTKTSDQISQSAFRWKLFAAHLCAMGIFTVLSFVLFGGRGSGASADLLAAGWLVVGTSAIALAGLAFLPFAVWVQLFRNTGYLWVYASAAVVSACLVGNMARSLWQPACYLTFSLTKLFLHLFASGIVAEPGTLVIGTERFQVEIAPQCSGLEGVGLILAFGILWLSLFRKECRFPRSLLLLPLAATIVFLLNSLRIAVLILIGNAGAYQIALGGFHSQAGWIVFSAVGVAFCCVLQRVPWFTKEPQTSETPTIAARNPTAAFLLPFLAILGGGMIARAAAAANSPEWAYPVCFFGAFGALWAFRRSYANLNWRFDWFGPLTGVLVFMLWVALDQFTYRAAGHAALADSSAAKLTWIIFRVSAAVVIVPIAEELAFRGFLMRRLVSQDFEAVDFQHFSLFALLASSAVFGLLQGRFWIAGILAGILFGLMAIRRGRIGDAVVAHASANALLCVYILAYHKWHLWW